MKIVCLFPGIGYTCDKPLLYYSSKMLSALDWQAVRIAYGGFPSGVKGNAEKMKQCAEMALAQTETLLKEIEWSQYDEILFVSKSVGTVVAGAYAQKHNTPCRHVLFTPVEATFSFGIKDAVAFHGTSDPWVNSDAIRNACRAAGIPLYITENANHSLETGDVDTDIENVRNVMRIVKEYAERADHAAEDIKRNLAQHLKKHPLATEEDVVKFVFQGMLGIGHLITSHQQTLGYIISEMNSIEADESEPLTERLSPFWLRLNLRAAKAQGLNPTTVEMMVYRSAKYKPADFTRQNVYNFCMKLEGFDQEKMRSAAEKILDENWLPSHSESFRNAYHPAYRVVYKDFKKLAEEEEEEIE